MWPSQPLLEDGTRHYPFAREYEAPLEDSPVVCNVTWFSNEAYFYMDAFINKQND
jgi:hypothetical protein